MRAVFGKAVQVVLVIALLCFVAMEFLNSCAGGVPRDYLRASDTRRFMSEVRTALNRYQMDHGEYPRYTGPPELGGEFLYKVLCDGEEKYLPPVRIHDGEKMIQVFLDKWGNPLHYQCGDVKGGREMESLTYDLWSTGGKKNQPDETKWITNWLTD